MIFNEIAQPLDKMFAALEATQEADGQLVRRWRLKNAVLDVLNVPTSNNTFYTLDEIPLASIQQRVENRDYYLYCDHTLAGQNPIDGNQIGRAAVLVERLWTEPREDGAIEVKIDGTVLNEGPARIIGEMLAVGGKVGFSKRGAIERWAEKEHSTGKVAVPVDYHFIGWDVVTGQSVADAHTGNSVIAFEQKGEEVMTLEQLKASGELWTSVVADVRATLAAEQQTAVDAAIEAQQQAVEDKIKAAVEATFAPVKEQNEQLRQVFASVLETFRTLGLVSEEAPSDRETALTEQLETLKVENTTAAEKLAALRAELDALKAAAPKPLDERAVEQFFNSKPGGAAVLETLKLKDRKFFSTEELEQSYAAVEQLSKAVLGTTPPAGGKGTPEVPDNAVLAAADLKRRAGRA